MQSFKTCVVLLNKEYVEYTVDCVPVGYVDVFYHGQCQVEIMEFLRIYTKERHVGKLSGADCYLAHTMYDYYTDPHQ